MNENRMENPNVDISVNSADDISQIENEIIDLMKIGSSRWVELYRLISRVEEKELFKPFSSLTAWAVKLCEKGGFQLRELWRYKKAGQFYDEYAARQRAAGKDVKELEEIDTKKGSISPRNFERVIKIAAGDKKVADRLIKKVVTGKLRASELEQMWKSKKASGVKVKTSRHDKYDSEREEDEASEVEDMDAVVFGEENADPLPTLHFGEHITATDIVQALLEDHEWLPENAVKRPYISDKYRLFTEFPVHTGSDSAGRIDALAVETIGSGSIDKVFLHGIEIKVDIHDLEHDIKMQEYPAFCDSFWIAVPETLREDALLFASERSDDWGVLVIDQDAVVTVVRSANIRHGLMRDKTLECLVYKLF